MALLVPSDTPAVRPTWHKWTMKVLIAALAIAVVLAWAFEITSEGTKRADEVAPSESITLKTGRKLVAIIVVVAALAPGFLIFRLIGTDRRAIRSSSDDNGLRSVASLPEKSIAVLPFEI